ncbi:hypothetical protein DM02DRAFT_428719 [Periconia macrospinosa]|uniref:Uncharacterized protein n=1 Tax=Periconia macrospinosa TaxID=97972 RepID=A0A2V1DP07_9PLEO|nr:hypothetical protein DM02DRAFT_428719 [Periconia macrospinosa]
MRLYFCASNAFRAHASTSVVLQMSSLSARRERSRFTPGSASISFGDGEALSQGRDAPVAATLFEQTTTAQHLELFNSNMSSNFSSARPALSSAARLFPHLPDLSIKPFLCVIDQYEKAVSFSFRLLHSSLPAVLKPVLPFRYHLSPSHSCSLHVAGTTRRIDNKSLGRRVSIILSRTVSFFVCRGSRSRLSRGL